MIISNKKVKLDLKQIKIQNIFDFLSEKKWM